MSIEDALQTVAGALAPSRSRHRVSAKAGRWIVLFGRRQRPLLMPAGEYQLQKYCVPYFVGNRLKASYALLLLKLNACIPTAGLLNEIRPAPGLRGATAWGFLGTQPSCAAVQVGTSGPYQKASALFITERGEGLALAKIALVSSADRMVIKEARWLKELEVMGVVAREVPRLLAEGETDSGRRFLVTDVAPSTRTTRVFTSAHLHFLRRLARSRMESMNFAASPCCEYLERALAELNPHLERKDMAQLEDAVRDCRMRLSACVCPFVFAQGDFSCWNIRLNQQRLFVFDWEYAHLGANPLGDVIHYHLIEHAASGRTIDLRVIAGVNRVAQRLAQQLYPEWQWRAPEVSALALAYILQVLLYYCQANGGRDQTDGVTRSYWLLMQRRAVWLTA